MKRYLVALVASLALASCGGSTGGDKIENANPYTGSTAQATVTADNQATVGEGVDLGMQFSYAFDNPGEFFLYPGGMDRRTLASVAAESSTVEGNCGGTLSFVRQVSEDATAMVMDIGIVIRADQYCNDYDAPAKGSGYLYAPYTGGAVYNGAWKSVVHVDASAYTETATTTYENISRLAPAGSNASESGGDEYYFINGVVTYAGSYSGGVPTRTAAQYIPTSEEVFKFTGNAYSDFAGVVAEYAWENFTLTRNADTGWDFDVAGRVYAGTEGYADVATDFYYDDALGENVYSYVGIDGYYGPTSGAVTLTGLDSTALLEFNYPQTCPYYCYEDYQFVLSLWDTELGDWGNKTYYSSDWELWVF